MFNKIDIGNTEIAMSVEEFANLTASKQIILSFPVGQGAEVFKNTFAC